MTERLTALTTKQEHGTVLSAELVENEPQTEEEALRLAAGLGLKVLMRFFRAQEHSTHDIAVAKVVVTAISAWTRMEQARGAQKAVDFAVARTLASDKDELREYVRQSMPEHPLAKRLPLPKRAGA